MQTQTERPNPNRRPDLPPQLENGKSKDIAGINMKVLIVMLAIALGASYLMNTLTSVTIKKFNSNGIIVGNAITAIQKSQGVDETNITALQTSIANVQTSIKTATDSFNADKGNYQTLQGQVTQSNTSVTALQTNIANDESLLKTLSTSLTALQTALGNVNISATQADVATLKSSLTADENTIKTLLAELKVDEAQMTAQESQIAALQSGITTTTTTTTGTTTQSGVTASIPTNLLGTQQSVTFVGLPNNTSSPNTENGTFTFTISNNTGATANNIQLGIILQTIQGASTSNPTALDLTNASYVATVSVSLNGYITTWATQSTGQAGVLAFVNNIPTGILAGLGTLSQVVGISNPYTVNINITIVPTTTSTPVPSFTIIPIVKVIGFTK